VYRKSDSAILVMKTAKDRSRCDDSEALNRATERGIFALTLCDSATQSKQMRFSIHTRAEFRLQAGTFRSHWETLPCNEQVPHRRSCLVEQIVDDELNDTPNFAIFSWRQKCSQLWCRSARKSLYKLVKDILACAGSVNEVQNCGKYE
jgi:hypothetical protein